MRVKYVYGTCTGCGTRKVSGRSDMLGVFRAVNRRHWHQNDDDRAYRGSKLIDIEPRSVPSKPVDVSVIDLGKLSDADLQSLFENCEREIVRRSEAI